MIQITAPTENQKIPSQSVSRFLRTLFREIGYTEVKIHFIDKPNVKYNAETVKEAVRQAFGFELDQCIKRGRKHEYVYALIIIQNHLHECRIPEDEILSIINRKRCDLWYYKSVYDDKYNFNKEFKEKADLFNYYLNEAK